MFSTNSPCTTFLADKSFNGIFSGLFCTLVLCLSQNIAFTQSNPYPLHWSVGSIHTPLLHPMGQPTAHPIIALDRGQLLLSFDDFSPALRTLELRVKHCTFDWYDSPDLTPSDYIDGFPTLSFETIEASFNTKADFTHYAVAFPNALLRFSKSGNYIACLLYTSPSPRDRG